MSYLCHLHVSCARIDQAVDLLLEQMPNFEGFGLARIELRRLTLPHFETTTLVALIGPVDGCGNGHVICLASAERFRACRAIERAPTTYQIDKLRGSVVDGHANVTLPDGTHVYDVRLDKHEMPGDLTSGERLALAYCLSWHERTRLVERSIPYSALIDRSARTLPQLLYPKNRDLTLDRRKIQAGIQPGHGIDAALGTSR